MISNPTTSQMIIQTFEHIREEFASSQNVGQRALGAIRRFTIVDHTPPIDIEAPTATAERRPRPQSPDGLRTFSKSRIQRTNASLKPVNPSGVVDQTSEVLHEATLTQLVESPTPMELQLPARRSGETSRTTPRQKPKYLDFDLEVQSNAPSARNSPRPPSSPLLFAPHGHAPVAATEVHNEDPNALRSRHRGKQPTLDEIHRGERCRLNEQVPSKIYARCKFQLHIDRKKRTAAAQ